MLSLYDLYARGTLNKISNILHLQNARCGAEGQTQTVEKPVSVISHAPGKFVFESRAWRIWYSFNAVFILWFTNLLEIVKIW